MTIDLIKAIPTSYGGIQFRSRLEARWAAFFDLLKWPWEYEPVDFDGWIPDFRLCGRYPAFCEVKPIEFEYTFETESTLQLVHDIAPNVVRVRDWMNNSGEDEFGEPPFSPYPLNHEIIILGSRPTDRLGFFLRERWTGAEDWAQLHEGYRPYAVDYRAGFGWYGYRLGGQYEGDQHLKSEIGSDVIGFLWREAGNRVQWKKPQ